jgi:hypothetical protein
MKWQKNPSFRKGVTPWHRSDLACLLVSAFSAFVFYFSMEGVGVALEYEPYQRHVWVPILLLFLSGTILVGALFRILRRMVYHPDEEE